MLRVLFYLFKKREKEIERERENKWNVDVSRRIHFERSGCEIGTAKRRSFAFRKLNSFVRAALTSLKALCYPPDFSTILQNVAIVTRQSSRGIMLKGKSEQWPPRVTEFRKSEWHCSRERERERERKVTIQDNYYLALLLWNRKRTGRLRNILFYLPLENFWREIPRIPVSYFVSVRPFLFLW